MKKVTALFIASLLLVSCNLTAQLIGGGGGGRVFTYTKTYVLQGNEHSFEVIFTVADGKVAEMTMEPQATTPAEYAEQLAYSANIRRRVLGKEPKNIVFARIGEESQELGDAFRNAVEKLQGAVP